MEKGFFAKHGLDAKVIQYQSGVDMVNGMLGGAQEVSVMGSIPFMVGAGKGQPLILIGTNQNDPLRTYFSAYMSVVGRAGAGLKEGDLVVSGTVSAPAAAATRNPFSPFGGGPPRPR